jgi:hypothetical protein
MARGWEAGVGGILVWGVLPKRQRQDSECLKPKG